MRKLLILDSSVVLGTPSLLAAPSGPEMRPRVSASAASMRFTFAATQRRLQADPRLCFRL